MRYEPAAAYNLTCTFVSSFDSFSFVIHSFYNDSQPPSYYSLGSNRKFLTNDGFGYSCLSHFVGVFVFKHNLSLDINGHRN